VTLVRLGETRGVNAAGVTQGVPHDPRHEIGYRDILKNAAIDAKAEQPTTWGEHQVANIALTHMTNPALAHHAAEDSLLARTSLDCQDESLAQQLALLERMFVEQ
jgi:hypothetical protein